MEARPYTGTHSTPGSMGPWSRGRLHALLRMFRVEIDADKPDRDLIERIETAVEYLWRRAARKEKRIKRGGGVTALDLKDKRQAADNSRYSKRKALGLCVQAGCKDKPAPGRMMCQAHLERARRYNTGYKRGHRASPGSGPTQSGGTPGGSPPGSAPTPGATRGPGRG